jgi:hypothetical protein
VLELHRADFIYGLLLFVERERKKISKIQAMIDEEREKIDNE